MVIEKFSTIENKNVELPTFPPEPFSEDKYAQKVYIIPIKDLRSLTISFTTADLTAFYKSAVSELINNNLFVKVISTFSHISSLIATFRIYLGTRAKAAYYLSCVILVGAMSELKIVKLHLKFCIIIATFLLCSLMAGHQNTLNGFGFFEIVVDLTQEGMEHVDDIVNIIFQVRKNCTISSFFCELMKAKIVFPLQYLSMLRKEGPKKWIFDEYVNINEIRFRFKDKEQPENMVTHAVSAMQVCKTPLTAVKKKDLYNFELI